MLRYVIRRVLYAFPILIGVSLLTFFLFYASASPRQIARNNISAKKNCIHIRGQPPRTVCLQMLDDGHSLSYLCRCEQTTRTCGSKLCELPCPANGLHAARSIAHGCAFRCQPR